MLSLEGRPEPSLDNKAPVVSYNLKSKPLLLVLPELFRRPSWNFEPNPSGPASSL
ncbi:hypothetical protein COCNU_02G003720 [Cocos nucifera]|uniref:Uncharacterized protein n=1 Tax=Cocos nucifera TaxID=13894 RepID=A0A8K0HYT3_COCNU|nr:hypothetical protein COCNU_02G003720 [Cocos nucifera]